MSAGETMVVCHLCEHENEADQRFCDECGAELSTEESETSGAEISSSHLEELAEIESPDLGTIRIEQLLSLGRLNRYLGRSEPGQTLLVLEETNTAPGLLQERCETLQGLNELPLVWTPEESFVYKEKNFAVGELPDSPSLLDLVVKQGPLGSPQLRDLAEALLELLEGIHRKSFLLRSLQPDRIWWNSEEKLLLVESFERLVDTAASQGDFQVVNGFSAPEAYGVGGVPVSEASDLYTAGAILHFAASGKRTDLESRERFFTFDPLENLDDPVLSACIAGLTRKELSQRIATTEDFRKHLNEEFKKASDTLALAVPSSPERAAVAQDAPSLGESKFQVSLQSHVGCVRTINQDACLQMKFTFIEKSCDSEAHLVAVVDGMGGEAEGDKAASIALRTIAKEMVDASLCLRDERVTAPLLPVTSRERNMTVLERALKQANRNIFEYAEREPSRQGMGCTVTACILEPNEVTLGHVGDTRAYHLRGQELKKLTQDHSLVGRLVEMGQLTEEEARNSPQRSIIYRAMGTNSEVDVDLVHHDLQKGDRLMMSSDGVWEYFQTEELLAILQQDRPPASIASQLIDICLERGADDNATVAVIFCV